MDNESAFPTLSSDDVNAIRPLAEERGYADGEVVFKAGQPDVVELGRSGVMR